MSKRERSRNQRGHFLEGRIRVAVAGQRQAEITQTPVFFKDTCILGLNPYFSGKQCFPAFKIFSSNLLLSNCEKVSFRIRDKMKRLPGSPSMHEAPAYEKTDPLD